MIFLIFKKGNRGGKEEENANTATTSLSVEFIESTFLFALIWSVGATIDLEGRDKFSEFVRAYIQSPSIVQEKPELKGVKTLLLLRNWVNPMGKGKVRHFVKLPPKDGIIYDYCYSPVDQKWKTWEETIVLLDIPQDEKFSSIVVQTTGITAML